MELLTFNHVLHKAEVNVDSSLIQEFIGASGVTDTSVDVKIPQMITYTCRLTDDEKDDVETRCVKQIIKINDESNIIMAWISRTKFIYEKTQNKEWVGIFDVYFLGDYSGFPYTFPFILP